MPVAKKSFEKNKNSIQNAKSSKKGIKKELESALSSSQKTEKDMAEPMEKPFKPGLQKDEKFVKDDGTIVRKSLFAYDTYGEDEPKKDSSVKESNKKIIKVKGAVETQDKGKKYALSSNPPQGEMKKNK